MRRKNLIAVPYFMAVVMCAVMGVFVSSSQAEVFSFYAITSNDPCNAAIGEQQLSMEVFDNGGYARFLFRNEGPVHSSITGIFFDDGSLFGISRIIDVDTIGDGDPCTIDGHPDVDFELNGNQNLPGGGDMEYPFEAITAFTVKSEPPPPEEGVESGESESQWVQIEFELNPGQTLDDVLAELMTGDPYPTLRVGVHVQSFNGTVDTSESFVSEIPEPMTICLFGLGGLALLRKRRK